MAAFDRIKELLASAEGDGAHGNSLYPLLRDGLLALAEEMDKGATVKKAAPVFSAPAPKKPEATAPETAE